MKYTLIVLLAVLAAGCSNVENGQANRKTFSGTVSEFKTSKGVDCVFAKDGYGGGLSCNWEKYNAGTSSY